MQTPFEGRTWADSARHLEALGYATLFMPDHFHQGLGPITAMAVAAEATTTLRVGSMVLAADFRHPAVLARELASLDLLSGGRLEVGLGAGYATSDYVTSGIEMDPPGRRVDRLIEYVAVLRGLFADESFSFEGEHFTIRDLHGTPRPHTPGGPPLIVCGGGRRLLTFAGAEADIVGVNRSIHSGRADTAAASDGLAGPVDDKLAWVRSGAQDRFDSLELTSWVALAEITDDAVAFAESVASYFDATPAEVLASPMNLIGTAAEIDQRLYANRDRWGFSYYVIKQDQAEPFATLAADLTGA